jgi:hypothetical protein
MLCSKHLNKHESLECKKRSYMKSIKWIMGGLAFMGVLIAALNYSGFCVKKIRFVSDEEKVEMAINEIILRLQGDLIVPKQADGTRILKSIRYKDIEDFKAVNKDCCELTMRASEGDSPAVLCKITGSFSSYAHIKYIRRHLDVDGKVIVHPVNAYLHMSNCGVADK